MHILRGFSMENNSTKKIQLNEKTTFLFFCLLFQILGLLAIRKTLIQIGKLLIIGEFIIKGSVPWK